jgi:mannose-6-phosphate isomerase
MGHDGNPRPLHVEQALAVINFDQVEPSLPRARPLDVTGAVRRWELCSNQYFVVERVAMDAGATFAGSCDGQSMEIWGTLSGRGTVAGSNYSVDLTGVRFTLLPAALGPFTVGASSASIWLRVYLP